MLRHLLSARLRGRLAAASVLCFAALVSAATAQEDAAAAEGPETGPKIVFVHGGPSHGRGAHEYRAGCLLLAEALKRQVPDLRTELHKDWPQDPTTFDDADSVVIFCSGGVHHPLVRRLEAFEEVMAGDAGLVCLHYAVEVPRGDPGDAMLRWLGGYFETHWSVNPHWEADFTVARSHPITRGVGPIAASDEWYYHMRFQESMKGVTPILSAVPPASTLTRPDGPHSGNAAVRDEVARGVPQHVAWAFQRDGGGRSFGFTGLHFHHNFAHDAYRTLLLNAVLWSTGSEVPEKGVVSKTPTREELEAHLD